MHHKPPICLIRSQCQHDMPTLFDPSLCSTTIANNSSYVPVLTPKLKCTRSRPQYRTAVWCLLPLPTFCFHLTFRRPHVRGVLLCLFRLRCSIPISYLVCVSYSYLQA